MLPILQGLAASPQGKLIRATLPFSVLAIFFDGGGALAAEAKRNTFMW